MVLQRVDSQPKPIHNNVGLKFFTITINVILVESYAAIKYGMDCHRYPLNLPSDLLLLHEMRIIGNATNISLMPKYNAAIGVYSL